MKTYVRTLSRPLWGMVTLMAVACASTQNQQSGEQASSVASQSKTQKSRQSQEQNGNSTGNNAAGGGNANVNATANINSAVSDFTPGEDSPSPAETNAVATTMNEPAGDPSGNLAPVQDLPVTSAPSNIPPQPSEASSVATPEKVAEAPAGAQASAAQGGLGPAHGTLEWVGYNFKKGDKKIEVQIVTDGRPVYKVFQETNRARQTEIVVRFLNTDLRKKIRRDIDASDFRLPVAYIRMRHDNVFRHTDVVVTMRDDSAPQMLVKGSSVMLAFDIADRWFGPKGTGTSPIAKAEIKRDGNVMPALGTGGEAAIEPEKPGVATWVDDPGESTFKDVPASSAKGLLRSPGSNELVPDAARKTQSIDAPKDPSQSPSSVPPASGSQRTPTPPTETPKNDKKDIPGNHQVQAMIEERYTIAGVAQASGDFSVDIPAPAVEASSEVEPVGLTDEKAPVSSGPISTTDLTGIDPNAKGTTGVKKALRFDFRAAPLAGVLRVISSESGINFVMPPDIGATKITISLKDVPWDAALKAILESNRLGMEEVSPRLIRVDTLATFITDRDAQDKAKQANLALVPTKILVMRLSYIKAEAAAKLVIEMLPKVADATNEGQKRNYTRFKVQPDIRMNAVVVEATPDQLGKIKTLLERLDVQTPQVKIASRIVEVLANATMGLGINWGSTTGFPNGQGLNYGDLPAGINRQSQFAMDPALDDTPVGSALFKFGTIGNVAALDMKLNLLEKNTAADSLQNQELLVEDMQEAQIVAGQTDYFLTAATVAAPATLTPIETNTSLKVTPHITADGAVQMKLEIKGDKPMKSLAAGAATAKSTREMTTTMLRKSGDTAVIGGFYSNDKGTSKLGIPYLSSIPIIGALFRSQSKSDVRRDLLIMITPTIVNANVALSPGENAPPATGAPATSTPTPGNGNIAKNAAEDVAKPKNSNSHNDAGDIGNASNTQAE